MDVLEAKFRGCLLGAMVGDIAGAVVEGEFPGYIRKRYKDVSAILEENSVPEPFGGEWQVGRFTDDTQMMLAVAEWLVDDDVTDGQALLGRFVEAYEPWRRYGPGTVRILQTFTQHPDKWKTTAERFLPGGSYGNGSAMRVAPVGLRFHRDMKALLETARLSSMTTHSHPLAVQGASLQATAVALAVRMEDGGLDLDHFLFMLRQTLKKVSVPPGTDDVFYKKLELMEDGFKQGTRPLDIAEGMGTNIEVFDSVPYAIYCAMWNANSYETAIHDAIFAGGDTDTVACMAGAIAGAFFGAKVIPSPWVAKIKEDRYSPERLSQLALMIAKATDMDEVNH